MMNQPTVALLPRLTYSFRDLRMRFEAPNEQNRWDCPLFKVAAIDEGKQAVVESPICRVTYSAIISSLPYT